MAVVGRQSSAKANRGKIPVFFVGLLFGMMLMFVVMMNIRLLSDKNSRQQEQQYGASSSLLSSKGQSSPLLRSITAVNTDNQDGWHPINVYYGEKKGLKVPSDQEWFAQVHQDRVLVDLLGSGGYFIDLAANDASEYSNTLSLEKHGWNGLCVEPNPTYWYRLSHRKCTVVGALVGAKHEPVQVSFRGVFGGIVGKMDGKLANRKKEPHSKPQDRYTASFLSVLERFSVPASIDYLSLDVEGAEYMIMKEFPFDRYQIKVMTVERPSSELRLLLESNGYMFLKDLAWWGETLWAHRSTGLTPDHPKIKKIVTEERH